MSKMTVLSLLREHQQESYVAVPAFGVLSRWGEGGELSKSVKKGKFHTKIFFLIMLNDVMKGCKKRYQLM